MPINHHKFSTFAIIGLIVLIAPMRKVSAETTCNWGDGAATPISIFVRSCAQAGGVAHGCSCDRPSDAGNDYAAAQNASARQAQEAAEAERERVERQRQEEARKRVQEEADRQAKFIHDRDETASSLKGSTEISTVRLKGIDSVSDTLQLKGMADSSIPTLKAGEVVTTEAKKACPAVRDSSVVDTCNVPSGLPNSVDNAITTAYADALPGVSDRVRKGFQAVMSHDWKVAKAWFVDALNHDPGNANLKRLVELSDYTEKHIHQGGAVKLPKPSSSRAAVQLPKDSDIELLFPGWQPIQAKSSSIPASQLPKDSDIEFLFPGYQAAADREEAKKLNDYIFNQAIEMTANDPVLIKVSNRHVPKKAKGQ